MIQHNESCSPYLFLRKLLVRKMHVAQAAKQHSITLVGGSIPESSGGNVYNTCLVYSRNGELLAKHRKVRELEHYQVSDGDIGCFTAPSSCRGASVSHSANPRPTVSMTMHAILLKLWVK